MALRPLSTLSSTEEGRRLKRLRRLAGVTQEELSPHLGYKPGTSSNVSKIEAGTREFKDRQKRSAALFLSESEDLTGDSRAIYEYLAGDHDSLDRCLSEGSDGGDGEALHHHESGPNGIWHRSEPSARTAPNRPLPIAA